MPKTRRERQREAQIKAGAENDLRRQKRHDQALDLAQTSGDDKAIRNINEQLLACARDIDEILGKRDGGSTTEGIAEISLHLGDRRMKELIDMKDALLGKAPHLTNIIAELGNGKAVTPDTEKGFWAKAQALTMKFEEINQKLSTEQIDQLEAKRQKRQAKRQLRRAVATNGMPPGPPVGVLGDKLSQMMQDIESERDMAGIAAQLTEAAMVGKDKISDETVLKLKDLCFRLGPLYDRLDDTSMLLNSGQVDQYAAERSYIRTRAEIMDLIKEAERVTGQQLAELRGTLPARVGEMALNHDDLDIPSDSEAYADEVHEKMRLMEEFSLKAWSLFDKTEKINKRLYDKEITGAEHEALIEAVMKEMSNLIDQTEIETGKDLSEMRKSLMQMPVREPESPTLHKDRAEDDPIKVEMRDLQSRMQDTLLEQIDSFGDPEAAAKVEQKIKENKEEHRKLSKKLKASKSGLMPEPLQTVKKPDGPVDDDDSAVELPTQTLQETIDAAELPVDTAQEEDDEDDEDWPSSPSTPKAPNMVEAVKQIASRQVFHDLRDMRVRTDKQEKVIKFLLKKNKTLEAKQMAYDNIQAINTMTDALNPPDSPAPDPSPERMETALRSIVAENNRNLSTDMGNLVKGTCGVMIDSFVGMAERNAEEIKKVMESVNVLAKTQQSVSHSVQQMSQVLGGLKKDMEEMKARVEKLEGRVGRLENAGVD